MSWSAEAAQSFAGMLGVIQQTLGKKSKAKDEGISFCVGLTLAGRATVAAVKKCNGVENSVHLQKVLSN